MKKNSISKKKKCGNFAEKLVQLILRNGQFVQPSIFLIRFDGSQ